MKAPELVIMAAGMGSRYGGLKQIDSIDAEGHIIIDYSIYDAMEAGFRDITFVIKKEIEADFREVMDKHLAGKDINVKYVFQELDKLPEGYTVPEGRRKPWGTAHAMMCCRGTVEGPFAVINADDYYGKDAYRRIYDFLTSVPADDGKYHYAMVGYRLKNTVTEVGGVSRGICHSDEQGMLTDVTECHGIRVDGGVPYVENDGVRVNLDPDTLVSMNIWGFTPSFLDECYSRFESFLLENLAANPEKCEFYIPTAVATLMAEGLCDVRVLDNTDKWYGVTYKEDKPGVCAAFAQMIKDGKYPAKF